MNDKDKKNETSETVASFLRNNPEFFNEHPELLEQIKVPHPSGEAVSLVERQMSLLREQNEKTRQKLDELIEIARANEELARRMHMLALTLMDAHVPQEIFTTLYESLRKNFQADFVTVRILAAPAFIDKPCGDEFAGDDSQGHTLFDSVIKSRHPVCGRLKRQQQVYLFGDEGDKITSGVMVPLHGDGWGGVMAIGSYDADRFHPGMGVELLSNLGEILSIILKPWVALR
ncbi:MAG: DUF484 family protein [Gammaproteobacteria bacterium]|nr:DUF484 family protein [Gammaproteobacteria bacterium]